MFSQLTSYRLGYTVQRPYPWRRATPAILAGFLVISLFLTLLNVPLAAYEIVQEATYRPNDTLPPLLFSSLVPRLLQSPETTFSPQLLTVGETLVANNSVFNFTIVEAWDENLHLVPSFPYYNNPFSDGCDIENMTFSSVYKNLENLQADPYSQITFSVDVLCLHPTRFRMTTTVPAQSAFGFFESEVIFTHIIGDWMNAFMSNRPMPTLDLNALDLTVVPCCDCESHPESTGPSVLIPTEAPCRLKATRLVAAQGTAWYNSSHDFYLWGPPHGSRVLFDFSDWWYPPDAPANPHLLSYLEALGQTRVNDALQNVFQGLYHLVRLELGIILENQIFASPAMFNESIRRQAVPDYDIKATSVTAWAENVRFFNTTDRVPVISYLRPEPRLKPLGSAITSVFTSTFAMVSVLWTVFSIVASVIAVRSEESDKKFNGPSVEDRIDTNTAAISRIELSLQRLQSMWMERGLLEEEDADDEPDNSSANSSTGGHEEKSTLLVHHKQSDAHSAV
ncbi:hypothetical protein DFH08DRAFT_274470 [Mycena albidolilacea]|uniref:Uncharacterized protein n=1 Tax=Mycena albidolilacea TaxID=1033008 RepID=A0AAD7APE8_9AGAR|nr:hypothetical protein DFH08DRAFT_274470 [Mycena albidolilacea]